ncbi:Uncharacterised protein [uncultured Blautia sp.]|nr:Uncharacterised protein [uncultured Blautia sp.]
MDIIPLSPPFAQLIFPTGARGKGTKAGEIATVIRKIKKPRKEEKGIDKRGRIWYSNKAVGAVMSRAGKK